jgi:hypothetical protein
VIFGGICLIRRISGSKKNLGRPEKMAFSVIPGPSLEKWEGISLK